MGTASGSLLVATAASAGDTTSAGVVVLIDIMNGDCVAELHGSATRVCSLCCLANGHLIGVAVSGMILVWYSADAAAPGVAIANGPETTAVQAEKVVTTHAVPSPAVAVSLETGAESQPKLSNDLTSKKKIAATSPLSQQGFTDAENPSNVGVADKVRLLRSNLEALVQEVEVAGGLDAFDNASNLAIELAGILNLAEKHIRPLLYQPHPSLT